MGGDYGDSMFQPDTGIIDLDLGYEWRDLYNKSASRGLANTMLSEHIFIILYLKHVDDPACLGRDSRF
jgi:hypothetical protein